MNPAYPDAVALTQPENITKFIREPDWVAEIMGDVLTTLEEETGGRFLFFSPEIKAFVFNRTEEQTPTGRVLTQFTQSLAHVLDLIYSSPLKNNP
jgi:hypothetical protein